MTATVCLLPVRTIECLRGLLGHEKPTAGKIHDITVQSAFTQQSHVLHETTKALAYFLYVHKQI